MARVVPYLKSNDSKGTSGESKSTKEESALNQCLMTPLELIIGKETEVENVITESMTVEANGSTGGAGDEGKSAIVTMTSEEKSDVEALTKSAYQEDTRFHPPIAIRSLYWKASTLCFLLGCARPKTLGLYLWDNVPTVRALMMMAISGRFYNPTVDEVASSQKVGGLSAGISTSKAIKKDELSMDDIYLSEGIGIPRRILGYSLELGITKTCIEIGCGNMDMVESTIRTFESDSWNIIFGNKISSKPLKKDSNQQGVKASTKKSSIRNLSKKRKLNYYEDDEDDVNAGTTNGNTPVIEEGMNNSVSRSGRQRQLKYKFSDLYDDNYNDEDIKYEKATPPIIINKEGGNKRTIIVNNVKYTTPLGIPEESEWMYLCVRDVVRKPPEEVINLIKSYDTKYRFGNNLRSCTSPDFIVRAMLGETDADFASREMIEECASWVIPTITRDISNILNRMPLVAATHLLLLTGMKIYQRFVSYDIWTAATGTSNHTLDCCATTATTDKLDNKMNAMEVDSVDMEINDADNLKNRLKESIQITIENVLQFECDNVNFFELLSSGSEHINDVNLLIALVLKLINAMNESKLAGEDNQDMKMSFTSKGVQHSTETARIEILRVLLLDLSNENINRRSSCRLLLSCYACVMHLGNNNENYLNIINNIIYHGPDFYSISETIQMIINPIQIPKQIILNMLFNTIADSLKVEHNIYIIHDYCKYLNQKSTSCSEVTNNNFDNNKDDFNFDSRPSLIIQYLFSSRPVTCMQLLESNDDIRNFYFSFFNLLSERILLFVDNSNAERERMSKELLNDIGKDEKIEVSINFKSFSDLEQNTSLLAPTAFLSRTSIRSILFISSQYMYLKTSTNDEHTTGDEKVRLDDYTAIIIMSANILTGVITTSVISSISDLLCYFGRLRYTEKTNIFFNILSLPTLILVFTRHMDSWLSILIPNDSREISNVMISLDEKLSTEDWKVVLKESLKLSNVSRSEFGTTCHSYFSLFPSDVLNKLLLRSQPLQLLLSTILSDKFTAQELPSPFKVNEPLSDNKELPLPSDEMVSSNEVILMAEDMDSDLGPNTNTSPKNTSVTDMQDIQQSLQISPIPPLSSPSQTTTQPSTHVEDSSRRNQDEMEKSCTETISHHDPSVPSTGFIGRYEHHWKNLLQGILRRDTYSCVVCIDTLKMCVVDANNDNNKEDDVMNVGSNSNRHHDIIWKVTTETFNNYKKHLLSKNNSNNNSFLKTNSKIKDTVYNAYILLHYISNLSNTEIQIMATNMLSRLYVTMKQQILLILISTNFNIEMSYVLRSQLLTSMISLQCESTLALLNEASELIPVTSQVAPLYLVLIYPLLRSAWNSLRRSQGIDVVETGAGDGNGRGMCTHERAEGSQGEIGNDVVDKVQTSGSAAQSDGSIVQSDDSFEKSNDSFEQYDDSMILSHEEKVQSDNSLQQSDDRREESTEMKGGGTSTTESKATNVVTSLFLSQLASIARVLTALDVYDDFDLLIANQFQCPIYPILHTKEISVGELVIHNCYEVALATRNILEIILKKSKFKKMILKIINNSH